MYIFIYIVYSIDVNTNSNLLLLSSWVVSTTDRSNLTWTLFKHFATLPQQLQGDGYHTSPAHQRTPLVPHDLGEDFNLDFDDDFPIDARRPKNAK